jgi:hypothetical protein
VVPGTSGIEYAGAAIAKSFDSCLVFRPSESEAGRHESLRSLTIW